MEIAEKLTVTDKVKSKVEAALGVSTKDARLSLTFLSVAFIALLIGGFPYLSKRTLTPTINKLGLVQTACWTIGMLSMSGSMYAVGLYPYLILSSRWNIPHYRSCTNGVHYIPSHV